MILRNILNLEHYAASGLLLYNPHTLSMILAQIPYVERILRALKKPRSICPQHHAVTGIATYRVGAFLHIHKLGATVLTMVCHVFVALKKETNQSFCLQTLNSKVLSLEVLFFNLQNLCVI